MRRFDAREKRLDWSPRAGWVVPCVPWLSLSSSRFGSSSSGSRSPRLLDTNLTDLHEQSDALSSSAEQDKQGDIKEGKEGVGRDLASFVVSARSRFEMLRARVGTEGEST